ncbi:iron donor protein CyaY [Buchnera aphidicola]|uniref:iron donor protein CyaY n=1 Tax=Buchnera aphidicola TaxID=9 RepID=UPI0034649A46
MKLTQLDFYLQFEKILFKIEEYLNTFHGKNDIDYEINNNIMTISFQKNNKIIINKQTALKQIWLATKKNGYHFNYENFNWICNRTKRNIWNILEESFYTQGKEKVNFSNLYDKNDFKNNKNFKK